MDLEDEFSIELGEVWRSFGFANRSNAERAVRQTIPFKAVRVEGGQGVKFSGRPPKWWIFMTEEGVKKLTPAVGNIPNPVFGGRPRKMLPPRLRPSSKPSKRRPKGTVLSTEKDRSKRRPNRPPNCYLLYASKMRHVVRADDPEVPNAVTKTLGRKWRCMSEEERYHWKEVAKKAMEERVVMATK